MNRQRQSAMHKMMSALLNVDAHKPLSHLAKAERSEKEKKRTRNTPISRTRRR